MWWKHIFVIIAIGVSCALMIGARRKNNTDRHAGEGIGAWGIIIILLYLFIAWTKTI